MLSLNKHSLANLYVYQHCVHATKMHPWQNLHVSAVPQRCIPGKLICTSSVRATKMHPWQTYMYQQCSCHKDASLANLHVSGVFMPQRCISDKLTCITSVHATQMHPWQTYMHEQYPCYKAESLAVADIPVQKGVGLQ